MCIEANPDAFALLERNRAAACVHACLDEHPRSVTFAADGEVAGIVAPDTDNSPAVREERLHELATERRILKMDAVPLSAVLDECGAPAVIDYLSIDIEGAETRVLRRFPFDRYTFLAMTIERPTRELNRILLDEAGYRFVRNVRFDSYYVHESLGGIDRLSFEPFEQVPPKDW